MNFLKLNLNEVTRFIINDTVYLYIINNGLIDGTAEKVNRAFF